MIAPRNGCSRSKKLYGNDVCESESVSSVGVALQADDGQCGGGGYEHATHLDGGDAPGGSLRSGSTE